MKKTQLRNWKIVTSLVGLALLVFAGSVSAALTVTTINSNNANTFTPAWPVANNSLIAGLSPTVSQGNFTQESAGGIATLTDGAIGPVLLSGNQTAMATCGNNGGQLVIYDLPANANGYNITNISTYSGWGNGGRHAQAYTLYYATKASPRNFILLGNVVYSGGFTGNNPNNPSANEVIWADSAGGTIAANAAAILIDFSTPVSANGENGYSGYSEITVQGPAASNVVTQSVVIATSTQQGAAPFTPSWTLETPSLIGGLMPSATVGSFAGESPTALGSRDVSTLTANGNQTISLTTWTGGNTTSPNYVTAGAQSGIGNSIVYTLTNNLVNGSDVTNIVVYNGWADNGRMGQEYNVSYSTVSAPNAYIPITLVYYLPSTAGGTPVANRVAIMSTNGIPLASGVANIKFDFANVPVAGYFNNNYQGYGQIIVQGHDTTAPPPPPSALLTQDILPSYAATVVGDQITFTASYSNSPPVTPQWLVISGGTTNTINTGVVNVTNNGVVTSMVTVNNLQTTNSGNYVLEGLNATNGAAAPSFSSQAQLVVNSAPAPVGNIIMNYAEQAGQGAISPVNTSTNFTPTWTVNTFNDLISGFLTNASPSIPGTSYVGPGNFDVATAGGAPCNPDPTILSDGSGGYVTYWPNVGGNLTQCECGISASGAGQSMTYTLPSSATYGFDVTNITVYGGWGDHGRNEQKYEILYSTVANPTAFTSLGTFDYNPNDPANQPSATRTMLVPVSGALAQNVYAVEINWDVAAGPKNGFEGYSEVVVQGTPSINNPILVQDTLPAMAATMVGDQVVFTADFSNAPAASLQWQFINTNGIVSDIAGATTGTLTLNNLQLTNTGSYRLEAISLANGAAITYSTAASLKVSPMPAAVNNIVVLTANQVGLGPISGVNLSTNFNPTWTEDTNNDLILGSVDGGPGVPGTVYAGLGNFAVSGSGCNGDPAILSDGSFGYQNYYPGIGGNQALDTCGFSAGNSVTYTLPASSATGWSLTNITIVGGWGNNQRDDQVYWVLYSTISAPTVFNNLISVNYNPAGTPAVGQSASRTTLVPAAGAMAQNVYAIEINWYNAAVQSKNGWSGVSEIVVAGEPSPPVPVLTSDVTPGTAEDVVGSSVTLSAGFSGATSYQWLKDGTNLPAATNPTLTLANLKLTDLATNIGYRLVAFNGSGSNVSSACKVYVDPAPTAVSNIVTTVAYQTSLTAGFGPTWDISMLANSLIYGQNPPLIAYDTTGNFNDPDVSPASFNMAGGLPVLTDGGYGVFDNTGPHPAFATCGPGGPAPGAGQYVIYTLGNYSPDANGYDVTNIQISGGWNDNGRDSQYYTVLYSTVQNPTMFYPMVVVANNLSSGNLLGGGNGEAVPSGSGVPTTVRTTFTPASGLLASNVYALEVDYQFPAGVPNGYSGYSEISVFGSPSAAAPPSGPVITTAHEEYSNAWVPETPSLIAGQLPSSYGPGVFTEEGCNETNLTDGILDFGNLYSASCGDDGTAVPWLVFSPTNGGSWNLTNIVVYTLWHDFGRDGQYYNLSYSTTSAPMLFLPLASVAYNPFVPHDGRASGNRVQLAPATGQTLLASNVAAIKFDFTPQGSEDYGWSGYTQIILQGDNLPPTIVIPPTLAPPHVSGGNLIVTGTGGTPGAAYTWLQTTNLTPPIIWTTSTTGNLDGTGYLTNSLPITPGQPDNYYRLRMP
jgi:hypothetical protein